MSSSLKVSLGMPHHGWIEITLEAGGVAFTESFSRIPHVDCLGEIVSGLCLVSARPWPFAVRMNTEPIEYDLAFEPRENDGLFVEVRKYALANRGRRSGPVEIVFSAGDSRRLVSRSFWMAFRTLQSHVSPDELRENWPEFPFAEIDALGEAIKLSK